MPDLLSIPLFTGSEPYTNDQDNVPLQVISQNFELVNNFVDSHESVLEEAQGTSGNLATRLDESLNSDGTLITEAIDNALHSIEEHTDGGTYVRFELDERIKLSTIASEANSLSVHIDTISTTVSFDSGLISVTGSDTIEFVYSAGTIKAQTVYDPTAKYYNVIPYTTNYQDYATTISSAVPYISGSLRVYVNGIRLNDTLDTYVPTNFDDDITWVQMGFLEVNSSLGTFELNSTVTASDIVIIDFDKALV